jgi:hypothetical protein
MAKITKTGEGPSPTGGLSDDQMRTIGRIAVAYSYLEFAALLILATLIHEDTNRGIRLVAGDQLHQQLERIGRLIVMPRQDLDAESRTAIDRWVRDANKVREQRNRVFHSIWMAGVDEGPTTRLRYRKGQANFDDISDEQLSWVVEALEAVIMTGYELLDRLRGVGQTVEIDPDDIPVDDY